MTKFGTLTLRHDSRLIRRRKLSQHGSSQDKRHDPSRHDRCFQVSSTSRSYASESDRKVLISPFSAGRIVDIVKSQAEDAL